MKSKQNFDASLQHACTLGQGGFVSEGELVV